MSGQIAAISTWEGAIGVVFGLIGIVGAVAAAYVIVKGRRSTALSDLQDKANNALAAELSASQATIERVTDEVASLRLVMNEKQHQLDDKQRQIDRLGEMLTQKAEVAAVGAKVDLILDHLEIAHA